MPTNSISTPEEIRESLLQKSVYRGLSREAPDITEELDSLVNIGLANQVMDDLHKTDCKPDSQNWGMPQLHAYAEELKAKDLGKYLLLMNYLATIIRKVCLDIKLAAIPVEASALPEPTSKI